MDGAGSTGGNLVVLNNTGGAVGAASFSGSYFVQAAVAPAAFGSVAAGQVPVGDNGTHSIQAVTSTLGISTFGGFANAGPTGINTLGLAFAPPSFGAQRGNLFMSASHTGDIYVINASGRASLFTMLTLPTHIAQGSGWQIAFAQS